MSDERDDELARTATAPGDRTPPPEPRTPEPAGQTIGRYRLERELGVGGMGVVHVAFDPDLERRVALKVLRGATGDEAAKRLQREARAMARLNHPNVVTVHEVGSAAGRDYVAMELIDGESLAEWLRASPRDPRAIVDVFVAAGRGLAAAHAAGIVHRDFKPHNVLRSRHGRIAVTDFGLAREAYPAHDALAMTLPVGATPGLGEPDATAAVTTPSALSGLTVSGSVLGTPAYMAPEQWNGGAVTPATDQFGYCVALWEALTGERPYRGPTLDDLRAQAAKGPQALDASRIPRRLRPILIRGLDPDPARRWPSMDELLARIARAERRPWVALSVAGGVAIVAIGAVVLVRGGGGGQSGVDVAACPEPVLSPDVVWPATATAELVAKGQAPAARLIAADDRAWRAQRRAACAMPPTRRAAVLTCLDGVQARLSAVAQAARDAGPLAIDAGVELVDPAVCQAEIVPRLVASASPAIIDVLEMRLRGHADPTSAAEHEPEASRLAERVADEPCASALAQSYLTETTKKSPVRDRALELAEQAAERCGDDRIRAEVAIAAVDRAIRAEFVGTAAQSKIERAGVAVQRVLQPDLTARLALYRLYLDARTDRIDQAVADGQAATAGFALRGRIAAQIEAGMATVLARQLRATPADLAAISTELAQLRKIAEVELRPGHPMRDQLENVEASWAFVNGDVAGAHARFAAIRRVLPVDGPRRVVGKVVDSSGAPVEGATVVTGRMLVGDSIGVASGYGESGSVRITTTRTDGTFEIVDSESTGVAVAQRGAERSLPREIADSVELVLEPTSRISGRVALGGLAPTRVLIGVTRHAAPSRERRYSVVAPVSQDGTFTIDGAPRGKVDLAVSVDAVMGANLAVTTLDVKAPVVEGVALTAPTSHRTVTVLVRSTVGVGSSNAQVVVLPGEAPASQSVKALSGQLSSLNSQLTRPFDPAVSPRSAALARPGDLVAVISSVPEGVASACAVGLPADVADPSFAKALDQHADRIEVRCVPIPANAETVVVEVPPWPRFD